jgi:hypothetical protein
MKLCNQCGEPNINYQTEPVATWSIHDNCTQCSINDYIDFRETYGYSQEERAEMAAAFGPDANIIDVLTGEKVLL